MNYVVGFQTLIHEENNPNLRAFLQIMNQYCFMHTDVKVHNHSFLSIKESNRFKACKRMGSNSAALQRFLLPPFFPLSDSVSPEPQLKLQNRSVWQLLNKMDSHKKPTGKDKKKKIDAKKAILKTGESEYPLLKNATKGEELKPGRTGL